MTQSHVVKETLPRIVHFITPYTIEQGRAQTAAGRCQLTVNPFGLYSLFISNTLRLKVLCWRP
jgi:hypothetical protein